MARRNYLTGVLGCVKKSVKRGKWLAHTKPKSEIGGGRPEKEVWSAHKLIQQILDYVETVGRLGAHGFFVFMDGQGKEVVAVIEFSI